jgi:hypothetical protein
MICFPLDTQLDINIHSNINMLTVPAKIRWIRKSKDLYDGIGVEILDTPKKYLELVANLKSN